MKKIFLLISIILLIFTVNVDARILMGVNTQISTGGTYDWSARKVGEFRFENGALTTDSSSAGNTLTTNNVTADTTTYKQGSASGDFSGTTSYSGRADANLTTGFPGKSSTGYQNFLVMGWFYFDATDSTGFSLISKYIADTGQRSFKVITAAGAFRVSMSKDGGAATVSKTFSSADGFPDAIQTSVWYHIALWHDSTLDKWGIRIYEEDGSPATYNYSVAYTDGIYLGTSAFAIGASISFEGNTYEYFNGKADQVVVYGWPDGSNPTEQQIVDQIDAIRGGTAP